MKGWLVAVALGVVAVAAGVGLWVTWDATQTSTSDSVAAGIAGPVAPPTTSALGPVTTTTVPDPPACETGDNELTDDPDADWSHLVIDTANRLPATYAPTDLVDVTEAGFETRDQVRDHVIDDLGALRRAAADNGTPIVVVSGYRSFSYQGELFQERADEVGDAEAELRTARAGHSEHQLGTAVDVLDPGVGELTVDFATTPAGQWVAAHSYEYGFVVSYPEGGKATTCYDYEPWHLRYVGPDVAAEIHQSDATPRAWMMAQNAAAAAEAQGEGEGGTDGGDADAQG